MAFSLRALGIAVRQQSLIWAVALGGLSGCSVLQTAAVHPDTSEDVSEEQDIHYQTPRTAETAAADIHYRPIPASTLYSLLVAEMAGQRQRFDISLYNYMDQARLTRDPGIAERAARIAQYVGSDSHALEAVSIWLDEDPHNPSAHQAAAQLLMEQGKFDEALVHLETLQELAGVSQYDYLAANAGHLPRPQQEKLADLLAELSLQQPRNPSIWYARGIMSQHLSDYESALSQINQALQLTPDFLSASMQKARILVLLKRHDDAIKWLDDLLDDHPQQKGILVLRARIYLEMRKMPEALTAFSELHELFPEDSAILLSLALLEEELDQREQAQLHFYQLLAAEAHTNEAHYYLGRIAEAEEQPEEAVQHYTQVTGGREFLAAQLKVVSLTNDLHGPDAARTYLEDLRATHPEYTTTLIRVEVELLTSNGQNDDALALLTSALAKTPEEVDLLYTRAMLAERMNNLAMLESDLRAVIRLRPNHAEALNALGYTLADRTDRWSEALPLIERALELSPENPAVIDSLGWIYFRMGDIDRARPLLERAFGLMKDHEIAAHLGELLWISGERNGALTVWAEGLEQTPDSDIIDRTLQRLNVDPENLPQP
ncbi:tetratricopeptide repeat protein [Thalassolituus sp. LLYu03]|uniref:tetratricopeptide repeat protein n=1 Tax=Thalassolituus sp. LLYu03 TaxID=3421656 RepID=UPI003D2B793E